MLIVNANTVIVNGHPVAIVGKAKYRTGKPKVEVSTSTVGNNVYVNESIDFTDATGKISFKLKPTKANIELVESWQDNIGKNAVRMIDTRTSFSKTFNNMSISNSDADIDFESDIEVEFMGGQGV